MNLLTLHDMGADELSILMDQADEFLDVLDRPIPKVPTLRGRTVALLFFEPSTNLRESRRLARWVAPIRVNKVTGAHNLSALQHQIDEQRQVRYEAPTLLESARSKQAASKAHRGTYHEVAAEQ